MDAKGHQQDSNLLNGGTLKEEEEERKILLTLSNKIASVKNKAELFEMVSSTINVLFSMEEFAIAQINDEDNTYGAFMISLGQEKKQHRDYSMLSSAKYPVTDPVFSAVIESEDDMLIVEPAVWADRPGIPPYVGFWKDIGVKKVLLIALRGGGKNVGMAVFYIDANFSLAEKSALLKSICSQLAIAMSNIIANENIQLQNDEKSKLLTLSNEFAAIKTRKDFFNAINDVIKQTFGVTEFGIAYINDDDRTYSAFLLDLDDYISSLRDFEPITSARYDVKDSLFGMVIKGEDPVLLVVDDILDKPGMPAYVDFWKTAGVKQVLSTPLRTGGHAIGSLYLHIDGNPGILQKFDLLKTVCAQLSVVISNILANEEIERREAERELLLSLNTDIAAIRNSGDLYEIINDRLREIIRFDNTFITVLNEDRTSVNTFLQAHMPNGAKQHPPEYPINDGILDVALTSGDPVFYDLEEVQAWPAVPEYVRNNFERGCRYMTIARFSKGEYAFGFFMLFFQRKITPDPKKIRLLKALTNQLSIAVFNILANQEIQQRELEKTKLLAFSNAMASVRDKVQFSKILKYQLNNLFGITDYVIHELNSDKTEFRPLLFDPDSDFAKHPDFLNTQHVFVKLTEVDFEHIINTDTPVEYRMGRDRPTIYNNINKDLDIKSAIGMPIRLGQEVIALLIFVQEQPAQFAAQVELFKSICSQLAIAVFNFTANEKIKNQLEEIEKYRLQLEEEKIYLKEEIEISQNHSEIIGESTSLQNVFKLIAHVAASDSSVLLLGETGTGKELIARAIHNGSRRKGQLMIKVNCAALPASLIESELFGHERGSFTGATDRRIGKFELANRSTLFLDEIGEMPVELQVKLLRVLQEKEIERIGGKTTIKTDFRLIAATNRDLEKLMEEGRFRVDLFYRLNIFPINVPSLRERKEDIPILVTHFILRYSQLAGKKIANVSNKALQELVNYSWPGNIRELEHLIERSVLLTDGDTIRESHLPLSKSSAESRLVGEEVKFQTISENEKDYILKVLKHVNGKISGSGGAAEVLGLPPSTLISRLKKLGIRRDHHG
ncbi:MAG: sigma 54-interacting transcriptional regulator [Chitinophagaceae bacterium]